MTNYITVEYRETKGEVTDKLLKSIIDTLEANGGTLLRYERKEFVPQAIQVIETSRGM